MPSPFPGFDPYVEDRYNWSSFHAEFLIDIARDLRKSLPEGFTVNVVLDERQQRFVRIYDRRNDRRELVAAIELLSPTNKDGYEGTAFYRRKQRETRESGVHLLEIDLLRYGAHTVYVPKSVLDNSGPYDYVVTLADASRPLQYLFWRIGLRDILPAFRLPLTPDVDPVPLDLQAVFERCYDAAGLGDDIDYSRESDPPLSPADAAWAEDLLCHAGRRPA